MSAEHLEKLISLPIKSSYDFINIIIFQLGVYKEYSEVVNTMKNTLKFFVPKIEIDYKNKQFIVDGIIITEEI